MLTTKLDGGSSLGHKEEGCFQKRGFSIFFIISFFLVRITQLWFGMMGTVLLMIPIIYINGKMECFDKMRLGKKKIILTKNKMMQMNLNQLSKSAESKFSEALSVSKTTVKIVENKSKNTETTLQIAQVVDKIMMKTKKQIKKQAQKQRKQTKLREAIESSEPRLGTTGKNLCVEENPSKCLNCFREDKFLRRCKGCR